MPIANYTTEVAATKSITEIQKMLIDHKARSIMIDYEEGNPSAIAFLVDVGDRPVSFRLPANIPRVQEHLLAMRVRKPEDWQREYQSFMKKIKDQAQRVGWRIIRDWGRAQMAIIDTETVTIDEVFFPYAQVKDGKTIYQLAKERNLLTEGTN